MADKPYTYHGPPSGVTLVEITEGGGKHGRAKRIEREVMLYPDADPIELPEDHDYVKALVAQGFLRPADAETPRRPRRPPAPAGSTSTVTEPIAPALMDS